eukprot:s9242_g2.t1
MHFRRARLRVDLLLLEGTTDLAGLLRSQIQRHILLARILLPGLCLLLLVVHGQDPGDGLANGLDLCQLGRSAARHLRDTQLGQLSLHVVQLLQQLLGGLVAQLICLHAHHGLASWCRLTCVSASPLTLAPADRAKGRDLDLQDHDALACAICQEI